MDRPTFRTLVLSAVATAGATRLLSALDLQRHTVLCLLTYVLSVSAAVALRAAISDILGPRVLSCLTTVGVLGWPLTTRPHAPGLMPAAIIAAVALASAGSEAAYRVWRHRGGRCDPPPAAGPAAAGR